MQLDKENMKKIRWLIAFAVLLYLGVQNLDIIINTAQVLLGFLFPFIVGFWNRIYSERANEIY